MTSRQTIILRATVREHIRTGTPVGSAGLLERLRLPVSSATVRAEFSLLERAGFLSHPHASAGRIPTTAGYRYYVDHAAPRTTQASAATRLRTLEQSATAAPDQVLVRTLAHLLARLSGTLAVVATRAALVHEAGLGNLFRTPEFADNPDAADIERLLEVLEDRVDEVSARADAGPTVFIDGENPWVRSRRISVVLAAPTRASREPMIAALIGPIRMPYDRHLCVMEALYRAFHAPTAHAWQGNPLTPEIRHANHA